MKKEERDKRRERLRIFSNNNQWIKRRDLEQTLEGMSAQLREYRRDLQQIRMQEAATEAKIDKLQHQVDAIEASLQLKNNRKEDTAPAENKVTDYYDKFYTCMEGYSVSYSENGLEREDNKSTVTLYA